MKQPLVYIIVLNWNGYQDTIECIKSLKKIDYKSYKIVLVDNGSTNDSVKILKSNFPDIYIIVNKENLGFSGGCNVGIKYAIRENSDYILLLNNDTIVSKDFLSQLVEVTEKNQNIAVASPKIFYADKPKIIWSTGSRHNTKLKYNYIDEAYRQKDSSRFNGTTQVDCVWGCCMLIRTKVFKTTGLLNESYFMYLEDIDFCYRVKKAKFDIVFVGTSKIWHKVSMSSGGEGNVKKYYYDTRNHILFARNNLSNKHRTNYYKAVFIDRMITIAISIRRKQLSRAKMLGMGLVHGLLDKRGYYK